jgi:hypothetical protein
MPSPVYFPDSRVAVDAVQLSPVTQPEPMHGPDNVQLFQSMPDPPRESDEQGIGRSPGQRWPHMPHVEQYSFDSLANAAWHPGEVAPRDEQGWSAPMYYEQAVGSHHVWPGPVAITDPSTQVYTDIASVSA